MNCAALCVPHERVARIRQLRTAVDKERSEKFALRHENVNAVVNDLSAMPVSSLTQRSKGTVTNGRVKAANILRVISL